MSTIQVNLSKKIKNMKPMHGGVKAPVTSSARDGYFHYLSEAGIPYSRLRKVGYNLGGSKYVDIPIVFPDFNADETDPSNYDFVMTDLLMEYLVKANVEPYYSFGVNADYAMDFRSYRGEAPKTDYAKWARICEYIVRHYTEGWGNGYHHKITYWEIWNEPDVDGQMPWCETADDYYRFYDVVSKHLKQCFPHLKVGGYSSYGFYATAPEFKLDLASRQLVEVPATEQEEQAMRFFYGFFEYIKKNDCPIDFFSWHSYADVSRVVIMDEWLHRELEKLGYGGLETHLNEWNPYAKEFGTGHHSAEIAAMMLALQNGYTDICCLRALQTNNAPFCPVFDIRTYKPIHGYYSLVAFNALYRLGTQVECISDHNRLYAVAASNGVRHAIMISNLSGETQELNIEGVDLSNARLHAIDQERLFSWSPLVKEIPNNTVLLIEF